jgi:hypothetical protein
MKLVAELASCRTGTGRGTSKGYGTELAKAAEDIGIGTYNRHWQTAII